MHFEAGARSERNGFFFCGKTGRLLSRNGVPQADRERNRQKAGILKKAGIDSNNNYKKQKLSHDGKK